MRKWLIGCGVLFGVVLVLCIGVLVWAFTPPKIEIPPRQLPPNNAYPEYHQMGWELRDRFENDARFKQIEDAVAAGQLAFRRRPRLLPATHGAVPASL
jgi:hypothetical protein